MASAPGDRFEIAINTPAGRVTTAVDVPTTFVPVTAIVPLLRRLGEEAQALEEARLAAEGESRSCTKGCAACCHMLVPLSPPEAYALVDFIRSWPAEKLERLASRFSQTKSALVSQGLWQRLMDLGESSVPPDDETLDPINRDFYALRLACPFLEEEMCSIYDERPAACRELLVTSPMERCQDMVQNEISPIPAPVRVSPVLGLLWGELTSSPPRLIPLPIVLDWVERNCRENEKTWRGSDLLDSALDKIWRYLSKTAPRLDDPSERNR
ncbi:MAG: YkgJ family cysteine cluster protein [Nitrospira sp.]|nr:YkgJ family cysteine cluster protein [Nitrospira sp.]